MLDVTQRSVTVKLRMLRALARNTGVEAPGEYRLSLRAFVLLVVAPVVLSAIYFFILASDIYTSEAKYVIRDASKSHSNQITDLIQSSGISKATDDAHIVNEFFLSRDALDILLMEIRLEELFARPEADFSSKFPSLLSGDSKEALFKYYKKMVNVEYDKTTGISTLVVKAFRPEDAQVIASHLLNAGERLANRLTERMRAGLVRFAQADVDEARKSLMEQQGKLSQWRNRERSVDPTKFSVAMIEVIARLSLELATLRAEVADTMKASPRSPSLPPLQNRIAMLEKQIVKEKAALVGSNASLASQIESYEKLVLEKMLSEKVYEATVRSLENARSEAQRQQIYLETIVSPKLSDYSAGPWRKLGFLASVLVILFFYGIFRKLFLNMRRHAFLGRYFRVSGASVP